MKKLLALGSASLLLCVPMVSSAAHYHYLDIHGEVNTLEAPSAQAALVLVNALDDTIHSGVKLDMGELEAGESYGREYWYVTTTGEERSVVAASLDAAQILATDRAPHSGFRIMP